MMLPPPRPIKAGKWRQNDWFVLEGLHAGDVVVVDGALTLRPGAPLVAKPTVAARNAAGE